LILLMTDCKILHVCYTLLLRKYASFSLFFFFFFFERNHFVFFFFGCVFLIISCFKFDSLDDRL